MKNFTKLYILLTTFNGEKYISAQLDSLLNQTYANFIILISDDISTDSTLEIIKKYTSLYQNIILLPSVHKKMYACRNFEYLLENAVDADYIMFCDQDDVWNRSKVEITMLEMKNMEKQSGENIPLLVYTDKQYVDEYLNIIKINNIGFNDTQDNERLKSLLVQNNIYGCTMMINRALYKQVLKFSNNAENHDYWIALIAFMSGKIFFIPQKTLFYRQHSMNASGNIYSSNIKQRIKRNIFQLGNEVKKFRKRLCMIEDAVNFTRGKNIVNDNFLLAEKFVSMRQKGKIYLIIFLIKNNIMMQHSVQTLKLFFIILLSR